MVVIVNCYMHSLHVELIGAEELNTRPGIAINIINCMSILMVSCCRDAHRVFSNRIMVKYVI